MLGGLIGAIVWNLITWYFGIPSSSSHALIGGYAGAAVARVGHPGDRAGHGLGQDALLHRALAAHRHGVRLGADGRRCPGSSGSSPYGSVDRWFRRAQLGSAAAFSLSHGTNDAQKTMGIIAGLLVANRELFADPGSSAPLDVPARPEEDPLWIILSAHAAIGLGTLTGGWRIVRTMGSRGSRSSSRSPGSAPRPGGAATVILASVWGIPVSTTHTITGAIIGVGATQRFSAVRWGVAGQIVYAWILTIPMAAAIGALAYGILSALTH